MDSRSEANLCTEAKCVALERVHVNVEQGRDDDRPDRDAVPSAKARLYLPTPALSSTGSGGESALALRAGLANVTNPHYHCKTPHQPPKTCQPSRLPWTEGAISTM